jgi:hypothetical protein
MTDSLTGDKGAVLRGQPTGTAAYFAAALRGVLRGRRLGLGVRVTGPLKRTLQLHCPIRTRSRRAGANLTGTAAYFVAA